MFTRTYRKGLILLAVATAPLWVVVTCNPVWPGGYYPVDVIVPGCCGDPYPVDVVYDAGYYDAGYYGVGYYDDYYYDSGYYGDVYYDDGYYDAWY